jgi:hypothetical protein
MGFNVRLTGFRLNLAGNAYTNGFRRVPFRSTSSFDVKIEPSIKQVRKSTNGVRSEVRSLCCCLSDNIRTAFNYLENRETYRKLHWTQTVSTTCARNRVSLRVTFEMCAETHARLHLKCPLLLSDFNENWGVSTNFGRTYQYQISWESVMLFSSCYTRTGGQR